MKKDTYRQKLSELLRKHFEPVLTSERKKAEDPIIKKKQIVNGVFVKLLKDGKPPEQIYQSTRSAG